MTSTTTPGRDARADPDPRPMFIGKAPRGAQLLVEVFVLVSLLALVVAVPFAWGWGLTWTDIGLAGFFYFFTCAGITVGFHRYFTHRGFKATRPLRVGLAIVGSMAFQGSIVSWVADHRRHPSFTDKQGDPHSPCRHRPLVGRADRAAGPGWCGSRCCTTSPGRSTRSVT